MRKLVGSFAAASLLAASAAVAEPPTPEHVKEVYDFIDHGKGQGIVLVEAKICTDVAKTGDNKAECTAEVADKGTVKAGTTVYVWESFLLPKGDEATDVVVQLKQGDTIRETKDVQALKGEGWRNRTWQGFTLKKPGSWTFNVMRGDKKLKGFDLKVE